jgi:hypothetical protein
MGARGVGCINTVTDVAEMPAIRSTSLAQNVPNPFNPSTRINFSINQGGRTSLRIYDVAGRLVAILIDQDLPAGAHSVTWRGLDSRGRQVSTGVYFYALRKGRDVLTRSMLLLK